MTVVDEVRDKIAGLKERQEKRDQRRMDLKHRRMISHVRRNGDIETREKVESFLGSRGIPFTKEVVWGVAIFDIAGVRIAYRPDGFLDRPEERKARKLYTPPNGLQDNLFACASAVAEDGSGDEEIFPF